MGAVERPLLGGGVMEVGEDASVEPGHRRDPVRVAGQEFLGDGDPVVVRDQSRGRVAVQRPDRLDEVGLFEQGVGVRVGLVALAGSEEVHRGHTVRDGLRVLPGLLRYMDERKVHAARWTEVLRTCEDEQQFIWGPADPINGAHVISRIAEFVPRSKLTVLDDAPAVGHFPQVEAPELVVPLLADWLGGSSG